MSFRSIGTYQPIICCARSTGSVEFGELRRELAPFYSPVGRPSIDPELMIRMLIVGYCFGIRSERRLCDEVHLDLAYRWFCRLGRAGDVPDHSTFSTNRHGRFRQSDLLRRVFETVLRRCIREGLVGGEGFAIDASLIKAVRETFGRSGPCRRAAPSRLLKKGARRRLATVIHWLRRDSEMMRARRRQSNRRAFQLR
jgi:transposase